MTIQLHPQCLWEILSILRNCMLYDLFPTTVLLCACRHSNGVFKTLMALIVFEHG